MSRYRLIISYTVMALSLTSCAINGSSSIGSLSGKSIVVEDIAIEGGLEKAMASYEQFLNTTEETAMTPEAWRRLADLKVKSINKFYDDDDNDGPGKSKVQSPITKNPAGKVNKPGKENTTASLAEIETRSKTTALDKSTIGQATDLPTDSKIEQQILAGKAYSKEAIVIYKKILRKYPDYERNDQVLYQMSKAYGVVGNQNESMRVLSRILKQYPYAEFIDEVQFRRGEIFFLRRSYRSSEMAYGAVVKTGKGSDFYEISLYKHGWSVFKQSRYEEALDSFINLIDYKAPGGRQSIEAFNDIEKKRLEDTLRVISFSFSYLGGADAVSEYFDKRGKRTYEDMIYSDLGDHYLIKRRYADAAKSFSTFAKRNPLHKRAPAFQQRVIGVYKRGDFPKLVLDEKENFARIYDLKGNYWTVHNVNQQPETLAFIKQNLIDLANHYHALSQKRNAKNEYKKAIIWYRKFLASFPSDTLAPGLNYLMAELLFENKEYMAAISEYEKTAYDYPKHEKSSESAYSAVLSYREQINKTPKDKQESLIRKSIVSAIRFADTYPTHAKVPAVLNKVSVDMFAKNEFSKARSTAKRVVEGYPNSENKLQLSAWTVIAHSSFDLDEFVEAENSYQKVLALLPNKSKERKPITDRLAASVYKQGEVVRESGDYKLAVEHFLRVAKVAPQSKIALTAEYDAASVLFKQKDWRQVITILERFRNNYPNNKYKADVTQKLAVAYEESRQWVLAANEFSRISGTSKDKMLRQEAAYRAAELYEKGEANKKAISAYTKYIQKYPSPFPQLIEAMHHLSLLHKENSNKKYLATLGSIVRIEKKAGSKQTERTRYIAAMAQLEISKPIIEKYRRIKLVQPLKKTLKKKKKYMEKALKVYGDMLDYGVAEVTAAATYYTADIYFDFTQAILKSERPTNLNGEELEQYEIVIEEKAYPFEEKAISLHKKNLDLMSQGIYNDWIEKSILRLGVLIPARFAKFEKSESYFSGVN